MAAARSVVVTDVPGMREVVVDGAGAVVAPEQPAELLAAVVRRLGDVELGDAEGRTGRAWVEAHHDRRVQFDGIAALYDELERRRK